MAQPDIIPGTYFSLMLGNGASPEVFTALCGITTRSFIHQVNSNDVFTRDCTDPEAIPVRRVSVTGEQWDLAGEGLLNRSNLKSLQAAIKRRRSWRFVFSEPADDEVFQGFYAGPGVETNLSITAGDEDGFAKISIAIASDGQWDFTEVTP